MNEFLHIVARVIIAYAVLWMIFFTALLFLVAFIFNMIRKRFNRFDKEWNALQKR